MTPERRTQAREFITTMENGGWKSPYDAVPLLREALDKIEELTRQRDYFRRLFEDANRAFEKLEAESQARRTEGR